VAATTGPVVPARHCSTQARRGGGLRARSLQHHDERALLDPVAGLHLHLTHRAGGGRGDVHGRLVRLERDQRLLDRDGVARLHQHVDHADVLEVADDGDPDLEKWHG
jgi:hypothetical protein